jgi:hypothetical protein
MPLRLCLISVSLLLVQPYATARTLLEPRVGIEALLLNCILYDPSCLRAPVAALQSPELAADDSHEAVADAKTGDPSDPETTGSVPPR